LPTVAEILNVARQALSEGRYAEAEAIYRQLVAAVPQMPDGWHELGVAQLQGGNSEGAIVSLDRAVVLDASNAMYWSNLGAAHRQSKHPADALRSFLQSLACGGPTPQIHSNIGLARKALGQESEAIADFDAALGLAPNYATAHFNRANLLLEMGRAEEAIAGYRRTLELEPHDAGALCKLGVAYGDAGNFPAALDCYERAIVLQLGYPEPRRNRAMIWLSQGDYGRGWQEFEWRLKCDGFAPRVSSGARWYGEPLSGRTLLVHAEQGLGDTLQFVRYLPLLETLGGNVRLEVQPPLVPLLRESGFGRWLTAPGARERYDLQCPLMSLPLYVPQPAAPPYWSGPYLQANLELVAAWEPRIRALPGLRVGIAWAGNPAHEHDRFRSVVLDAFAPLAGIPGVSLVNLQKGAAREQLARAPFAVTDFGPAIDDAAGAFMDTAAIMRHLDLVISVDTALVHLAGGLGIPTWLPLHFSPDWRWMQSGSTTPWYPTLRLFRQPQLHAWTPVFAEMADSLRAQAPLGR
jgi:tetratricopeptide (TPR) repeat protein